MGLGVYERTMEENKKLNNVRFTQLDTIDFINKYGERRVLLMVIIIVLIFAALGFALGLRIEGMLYEKFIESHCTPAALFNSIQ